MDTAYSKKSSTRWTTVLCSLAIPALIAPPTIAIATLKASAQVPKAYGAGRGGDGGTTTDLPAQKGLAGYLGSGGKGGDGYTKPGNSLPPPSGGRAGGFGWVVSSGRSLSLNYNAGNGEGGQNLTADDIFWAVSPGGGGGGGTALLIDGVNSDDMIVVELNSGYSSTGGNGGNGGSNNNPDTSAGNGGEGGAGVYVRFATFINHGTITGGTGGKGGDAFNNVGRGGNGGGGVILADGSNLTNEGEILGGNGGAPGNYLENGPPPPQREGGGGTGGDGVYMGNNSTLINNGTIQGGVTANSSGMYGGTAVFIHGNESKIINNGNITVGGSNERQNAIFIDGNNNLLEIYDNSIIKGLVTAEGDNNNIKIYTEINNRTFDVSGQFLGFNSYNKAGSGRLTLEGETNEVTPWTVSAGTLAIEKDENLGGESGTLTLAGGTLQIDDDEFITQRAIRRPIILDAASEPNVIQVDTYEDDSDPKVVLITSAITGSGGLVKTGPGELVLIGDNTYGGGTRITEGELTLGNEGNSGSVQGPIEIGSKASLSIFRSDTFTFSNEIIGMGDVDLHGGAKAYFTADSSGFKGDLTIYQSNLVLTGKLGGTVIVEDDSSMSGTGSVEYLGNRGIINPGDYSTRRSLTIDKVYEGQAGSVILIHTVLGGDTSETDHLVVKGDTEGESEIHVINRGGKGGDTQKGIEVISVGGRSDAVFTLVNKDKTGWGEPAVLAGAHAYTLQKGSASDPSDGNWYLRTTFNQTVCPSPEPGQPAQPCTPSCPLPEPGQPAQPCTPSCPSPEPGQPAQPCTPTCSLTEPEACSPTGEIYQPGVPLYTGYGQFISSLNTVSSMGQRVGSRYWSGASARQITQGDGPGMDEIPDPNSPQILTDAGLIWGRIDAAHSRMRLYNSTLDSSYNSDQWNIRAGIDHQLKEYATSRLIGSAWLEYGSAKADLSSYFGSGDIDVNSYSLGTAITWFHENGFYLDGQGRFSWTRSDITSSTLNRTLVSGAKGDGFAFGLEAGRRLALNAVWSWTPQAQIIWSQTRLDDFSDPYEAEVSFDAFKNLTARAGVTVQYANTWQDRNGYTTRGQVYALANLYRELLGQSPSVIISDEKLKPGNADRTWGEVGVGGTYAFHNDKYALYGETALAGGLDDIEDNYTLRGNVGLRVHW